MRWALETKQTKILVLVKFNLYKPSIPYYRRDISLPIVRVIYSLPKQRIVLRHWEFAPVDQRSNKTVSHKSWRARTMKSEFNMKE